MVCGTVHEGSVAEKARQSAGDIIIAINGLRMNGSNVDALLARYRLCDRFVIHAFCRYELLIFDARIAMSDFTNITLALDAKPAAEPALREGCFRRK